MRDGPVVVLVFRPLRRFVRMSTEEARRLVVDDPEGWRWPTVEELKRRAPSGRA